MGERGDREGEDQERSALKLMQRNGPRIAEPDRTRAEKGGMADEEIDRNVGAARRMQHHDGEETDQRREPDTGAPLAGRDPNSGRAQQQDDDGKAGGIEDMLAVDPQQEFRGNGDDAGNRMQLWLLGAQQQAERQS